MSKVPLREIRSLVSDKQRSEHVVALERNCKQLSDLLRIEKQKCARLETQLASQVRQPAPERQPADPPEKPIEDDSAETLNDAIKVQSLLRKKLQKIKALSELDKEQICALKQQLVQREETLRRKTQMAETLRRNLDDLALQLQTDQSKSQKYKETLCREKDELDVKLKMISGEFEAYKARHGEESGNLEESVERLKRENETLRESVKSKSKQLKSVMEETLGIKDENRALAVRLAASEEMLADEKRKNRALLLQGQGDTARRVEADMEAKTRLQERLGKFSVSITENLAAVDDAVSAKVQSISSTASSGSLAISKLCGKIHRILASRDELLAQTKALSSEIESIRLGASNSADELIRRNKSLEKALEEAKTEIKCETRKAYEAKISLNALKGNVMR